MRFTPGHALHPSATATPMAAQPLGLTMYPTCKISSEQTHLISSVQDHLISWFGTHLISPEQDHPIS
jgi:hypothetical protein